MHTPEQAAELWCPLVRLPAFSGGTSQGGYNHLAGATVNRTKNGNFCIAGNCAMWRWVPTTESVPVETEGASGAPARSWKTVPTQTVGYCGIAGRPDVGG